MKFYILTFIFIICCGLTSSTAAEKSKQTPTASSKPTSNAKKVSNILFIAPFGSKSHKMFYSGIIEAIAGDGHKVTVITPYSSKDNIENVEEIVFEENDISLIMANAFRDGMMAATFTAIEKGPEQCFSALTSTRTQMVLEEKFDLAFVSIFFNECFLGMLHSKKIPFVFVNPAEMFGPYNAMRMGNPVFPSFSFNPMLSFTAPMTFIQRVISTFSLIMIETLVHSNFKRIDATYKHLQIIPEDTPPTAEIAKEASLMMVNSVRLEEEPKPYMPNIVLAGTIHCKDPKPLPKDLEDWISKSGEAGFIFFSIGSALRPSDVPEEKERLLATVFSELPQLVIWKHDSDKLIYMKTPKNIKLVKWSPQQDLLGHPKIKLFITHGGLHSTQEALYHKVPTLGIPVFGDQEGNMAQAESKGWAIKLNWADLTEEKLRAVIKQLIGNKKILKKLKKHAAILKDTALTPQQSVIWWTNYLIRHQGAKHLRSSAVDLYWFELYNTDVWIAVSVTILFLLWIIFKTLVAVVRRCCCTKKTEQLTKKSKNQKRKNE